MERREFRQTIVEKKRFEYREMIAEKNFAKSFKIYMHWAKRLKIGCFYKFQKNEKTCKNRLNIF